jgi:hypothetical protein
MEETMNGELPLRDCIRHRIHKKRHVVIDDANAHAAIAGLASNRFDLECKLPALPPCGHFGKELRGLAFSISREAPSLARQRVPGQRLSD